MEVEEPSFKEKKYDRQTRLWGTGGQRALEAARVCLLNATGAGTETLKNLILPGIGSFVIVDGQPVTEADLGNNFFVTPDNLHQPRGEWATKWLLELNPDVRGSSLTVDPRTLLETNPGYFRETGVSLVIATQLVEADALRLARILEESSIPLLLVRSYGLMGFLRLQSPSYGIMETFPDQQVEDYRVLHPFPELENFVRDLGDPDFIDDSMLHAHIPWVCLMVHYIAKWKAQTKWAGAELSYAQRKEILALVAAGKRKEDEENFNEARNAGAKLNPPAVPGRLLALLAAPEADLQGEAPDPFWVCVHALRQFYARHQRLPLSGGLADMTSTTQWFVQLQGVYRAKAQQDVAEMLGFVTEANRRRAESGQRPVDVPAESVALFCKNAWHVQYLSCRPLRLEVDPATALGPTLARSLEANESGAVWYLLLRASDRFHAAANRFPGENGAVEDDSAQLAKGLKALCAELGISHQVDAEVVQAWVRYGGAELHTVDAMLGGLASQEAIKLVTHQRVPVNNTVVFNGVGCTVSTLEL
eukprot:EG_transcript_7209